MGVTNRTEPKYKHVHSEDTDTLQIPEPSNDQSSTFAIHSFTLNISPSDSVPTRRQRRKKAPVTTEFSMDLVSKVGKRRQRRLRAELELMSGLTEEDEPEEFLKGGISHKSAFSIIMNNPDFHEILEDFIGNDTSKQGKMLEQSVLKSTKRKIKTASYANVSNYIKLQLKTMRNEFQLQLIEEEIVQFFSVSPNGSYMNNRLSSFQRLLLHGISQYYGLKSTSFGAEDENRIIKIENPKLCNFGDKRLYSIVRDNHSKRLKYIKM